MAKYAILNSIDYNSLSTDSLFISSAFTANGYFQTLTSNLTINSTFAYSGNQPVYLFRLNNSFADIIFPPSANDRVIECYFGFSASGGNYYRNGFRRSDNTEDYSSVSTTVNVLGNEYYGAVAMYYSYYQWYQGGRTGVFAEITEEISSQSELEYELISLGIRPIGTAYPITYHYTNSTINGPSEAAVGDTVTVTAVPDVDYGITDASTQILVTNNDIAVPFTWDATNNRITFTMPDPT